MKQPSYSTDQPFDAAQWRPVAGFEDLTDITYHRHVGETRADGIVRIAFDRPEVRNAFRPHTVDELYRALDHARRTPDVGCVLLTGNGTSASAAAPDTSTPPSTATTTPPPTPRPSTPREPRPRAAGCTSSRCSA